MKRYLYLPILALPLLLLFARPSSSNAVDCSPGYEYVPRSGVECKQIDCNSIPDAHYGSTGQCVCGSSGSIYEDKKDPNKECSFSLEFKACPGCVYACVGLNDNCPDHDEIASKKERCVNQCNNYLRKGSKLSQVLQVSGIFPNCNCTVDIRDKNGVLISTVTLENGEKENTLTFDPNDGTLQTRKTVSLSEERERIREKIGYKYTEEEIDQKVDEEEISRWFKDTTKDIKTSSSILTASFWTQHIMALLDHGFGNDADFVDTYKYGRCGDSMLWLERELSSHLDLGEKKQEAFMSITGENYGNLTNHTAIMIRPKGISNQAWADNVKALVEGSGKAGGLNKDDIKNIDERVLKAKVIDPYFKKEMSVEEFIKGWSVIRIS